HLAHDLGVSLVMVPVVDRELSSEFETGYCDMGLGAPITPQSALQVGYTVPYLRLRGSILTNDHRRKEFASIESIRQLENPRLGIEALPYYEDKALLRTPNVELIEVLSPGDYIENWSDELDGMITTVESASAWSLLHPRFTAVIHVSSTIRVPVAFPLPRGEEDLIDFLDIWIDLKESDGTIDRLYRYWVQGEQKNQSRPRWSVIRDVLHWTDE
ncbi:MAG: transporter substrate-binding domain-containing protein, partial [Pseudomonadota bacterium]|nr:transporter substrate-binding domain-containing protein [Pseudomonadota bacterium]